MRVEGHRYSLMDGQQSYLNSDEYTMREKLALLYTDCIMGNPLDADEKLWAQLHEEFTEPQLVAMGYYIGFRCGVQRFIISFHPEHGEYTAFLAQRKAERATAASG